MKPTKVEIKVEIKEIGKRKKNKQTGRFDIVMVKATTHTVWAHFNGGIKSGWSCADKPDLAHRLSDAIKAGKALNADGHLNFLMRQANTELRRLGF